MNSVNGIVTTCPYCNNRIYISFREYPTILIDGVIRNGNQFLNKCGYCETVLAVEIRIVASGKEKK